uniref:Glycerol-3-phosphate dehydrogenase n=1 Tax=Ornithodoros turicata TaxID=34597 RepID=A0A2R5LDT0_9ACAR
MASYRMRKIVIIGGGALVATYIAGQYTDRSRPVVVAASAKDTSRPHGPLLPRATHLKNLKETPEFDVLIIGGGATGCGVAVDSQSRGLRTAVVEMNDFSSGTSSRSTKLIHGGVRYLQKAVMNLDLEQYRMVREALQERANLLSIAPHLANPLPIMLPIYRWWQVPYYWAGIKLYDLVAGKQCLKKSYFLSAKSCLELFPMLKKEHLCGGLVYYDGQHNDSRMNITLALTAARMGSTIANHTAVVKLLKKKNEEGKEVLCGATVRDMLTGNEFDVNAKCIINATGPFTDKIRKMDDPNAPNICQPSSGVHIVLPSYYSPDNMGLLDPDTSDGRVIFFLPWEQNTIAGTTDRPCPVTENPAPTEDDIQFILSEVRHYLNQDVEVRRGDVLSAWAGIRPLVLDLNKSKPGSTEAIARNHIIYVSDSNLVTIAGGKWTTYRVMAQHTIDAAVRACDLKPTAESSTLGMTLEGGHKWTPTMYIRLVQDFGIEPVVAKHLASSYGDRASSVAKLAALTGKRWPVLGKRLHEEFPYLEAEVRYSIKEYACTAVDVIGRRLRLAFLNVQAAQECLPRIVDIMAEELKWSKAEKEEQYVRAKEFLDVEMGGNVNVMSRQPLQMSFTKSEMDQFIAKFQTIDRDHKGYISVMDLRRSLKTAGEHVSEQQLHEMLNEVDINKNGQIELGEYLELMNAIKTGSITESRVARAVDLEYDRHSPTVDRSGGGL